MGVGNPPAAEAAPAEDAHADDAAILRSLKPKWIDREKLARRVANDPWIKKHNREIEALRKAPLPTRAEADRLWLQVQIALAAFLPVWFAPAYRAMQIRKIEETKRRRALAIQEKMQRERVQALRGTIGLHHLKKLGVGKGARRMRFRGPLPRAAATGASPLPPSASPGGS